MSSVVVAVAYQIIQYLFWASLQSFGVINLFDFTLRNNIIVDLK